MKKNLKFKVTIYSPLSNSKELQDLTKKISYLLINHQDKNKINYLLINHQNNSKICYNQKFNKVISILVNKVILKMNVILFQSNKKVYF